ncbi:MAG TPA: fatty acid--CoA ligase family protein, partial [Ilumatobacteraceae bacterium]
AGGSIAAHRRFRAERVAASLLNGDCTFFIGVPTMYQRIVDHLVDAPTTDIAPWLAFGGAPMSGHLIERLHHVFPRARLANCYGLSEATSITHINFVDADSSTTAVGVAVAGTLDRVSPLGELLVCSPTTMLGYFNDPATTAAKFDDGWLLTGDLAERGDDGVVHVYGRVDDVINRGGEKILPIEIEEALCAHPAIVDAAVVGVPDAEYGSVVAAAVVSASALTAAEIAEFLESRLADHKLPARLITVAELPRNANGKILPAAVRELFR